MTFSTPITSIHKTPIQAKQPVLKVLGFGGGGSNAVNRMIELELAGVEYIAANTDAQALKTCMAATKIQLGPRLTRGLGAGGDPVIGEAAAEESLKEISAALQGSDMVFLTAGMGGGTGTGAIPIAARIARATGAVTISIVTMPFSFEVGRRQKNALSGLQKLRQHSDTLISVPNDRLLQIAPQDLPIELAFRLADDVLRQGIQGISEIITQPGLINVDFAHVRNMIQSGGGALLSMGYGQGCGKALAAVKQALRHPLLESVPLENATGIIANFTAGKDLTFVEVSEALNFLQEKTNHGADIIPGIINDERLDDRVQVIMVITGLGATPIDTQSEMKPREEAITYQIREPIEIATTEFAQVEIPTALTNNRVPITHSPPLVRPDDQFPDIQLGCTGNPSDLDVPTFLRRRLRFD